MRVGRTADPCEVEGSAVSVLASHPCPFTALRFPPKDLGSQTGKPPWLLPAIRKVRDDEGKNYGDDSAGDGWRDARALRNGFQSRGAETLLHLLGLKLILSRTSFGTSVRAISQNRSMAESLGINTLDLGLPGAGSGARSIPHGRI